MFTHPDTSIETYLDRIDARLATMTDDGDKAVFLNLCIGSTERKREKFEETLDPRYGDAIQISEILAGLHARHADVLASIKARVTQAEEQITKPEFAGMVSAFHARRLGFELAPQAEERV
ncbi:MAG TPA: hypothetical protein VEZ16_00270 [Microvirga sp.]|nr:hypothetical protein [Microvirga sp.]